MWIYSLAMLVGLFSSPVFSGITSTGGDIVFSQNEINEVSRVVEENIKDVLNDEGAGNGTRLAPKDIEELANEIEVIKNNVSSAECNITAGYLWELCRPVLLRTCEKTYRTKCRTTVGKRKIFARRLQRIFPAKNPPPFFNLEPLTSWIDEELTNLKDRFHDSNFQISLTISTGNNTKTYTNKDFENEIENATKEVHAHIEDFNRRLERINQRFQNSLSQNIFPWGQPNRQHPLSSYLNNLVRSARERIQNHHREEEVEEAVERKVESGYVYNDPSRPVRKFQRKIRKHMSIRDKRSPYRTPERPKVRGWNRYQGARYQPASRIAMSTYSSRNSPPFHHRFMNNQPIRPQVHIPMPWHHNPMPRMPMHYVLPSMPKMPTMPMPWHHNPNPHMSMPWPMPNYQPMKPWWATEDDDDEDEDDNDHHDEDGDDGEFEITCEQLEGDPEVCMEIADRENKCETELAEVCPEYMAIRRQVEDKLEEAITLSEQHQTTVEREENDQQRVVEGYQWQTQIKDTERPVIIQSIRVVKQPRGSDPDTVQVTAKIFDSPTFNLQLPDVRYDEFNKLGREISQRAMEWYKQWKGEN